MNQFAASNSADRRDAFEETAARMGLGNPGIVEKDFWVTWTLGQLFTNDSIPELIFPYAVSQLLRRNSQGDFVPVRSRVVPVADHMHRSR